jgi:hypothetical protein
MKNLDDATLDALADMICGEPGPVYRQGYKLPVFLRRAGLECPDHDGSTRKRWVLDQLRRYNENPEDIGKVVLLWIEGWHVYVEGAEPRLAEIEPKMALATSATASPTPTPDLVETGQRAGAARHDGLDVFIVYSHRDDALRQELMAHLSPLKREGLIACWHDLEIGPGSEWETEISSHLSAADIVLLLVTADLLASDYCMGVEAKKAMERHDNGDAVVVPVILRACVWEDAFGKLQALPKDARPVASWANRDEAFADVTRGIRKLVQELRARGGRTPGI